MKLKLYYMTGTGNSLAIARDIANEFEYKDIISIPELIKEEKKTHIEGDIVGFVFPVYFARPPVYIKEFIEQVNFGDIPYLFALMNGGGLFGRALHLFNDMLKKKGRGLDAGFIISMPGNHPKIGAMQFKTPEKHYAQKDVKIKTISHIIKTKKPHRIESNLGILGAFLSRWAFRKQYKLSLAKELDSFFWVNDACVHCGTCEQICPVSNISDSATKPQWHNNCINCAACYNHCKVKAICLGNEDPDFRYRHPEAIKGLKDFSH